MGFSFGVALGVLLMFFVHKKAMDRYKKLLQEKGKAGEAEMINGEFYYIKSEREMLDLKLRLHKAEREIKKLKGAAE